MPLHLQALSSWRKEELPISCQDISELGFFGGLEVLDDYELSQVSTTVFTPHMQVVVNESLII